MDFPLPLVAGAVISGAFFGDKLSPLSDTTNVAPAMVEENLFAHVRHMLWDTIPAFAISILLYWMVGLNYASDTASINEVNEIMWGLEALFVIHPFLFIVPIITLFLMMKQYPAIPSLVLIAMLGVLTALLVQGSNVTEIIQAMTSGYVANSGVDAIDSLLSNGGIHSMLNTIGLVIIATALGGVLESTGVFKTIVTTIVAKIRSTGALILSTVLSTFIVAFASGAQFLAIILPARGFFNTYKKFGLSPLNLSRSVEAAGTVGITLVPWGVPAVFAAGVLGVPATEFIPFIFFAYLVPLINVLYGYTGFSIKRLPDS
jgi:NhaC family Na+:H+ antiporter